MADQQHRKPSSSADRNAAVVQVFNIDQRRPHDKRIARARLFIRQDSYKLPPKMTAEWEKNNAIGVEAPDEVLDRLGEIDWEGYCRASTNGRKHITCESVRRALADEGLDWFATDATTAGGNSPSDDLSI